MSLQDEIKTRLALADAHSHDVASGTKPDHETRQLLMWLAADVKYLLSELDKHAAPVVDMTPGGSCPNFKPRQVAELEARGFERVNRRAPFTGLTEVSSVPLPRDAATILAQHADELYVSGDGKQPCKDIGCHAGTDGDCYWSECPQIMDGEPHKSGRSCPLCNSADDS